MLAFEFLGAPGRHYPVEWPSSLRLHEAYKALLADRIGTARVHFAGRLATYRYLDMDVCMRQAIDCADAICR